MVEVTTNQRFVVIGLICAEKFHENIWWVSEKCVLLHSLNGTGLSRQERSAKKEAIFEQIYIKLFSREVQDRQNQ